MTIFFWDSCNNYHYYTWRSSGTAVIIFTIIQDDLLLGQLWSLSLLYMTILFWDSCDHLHYNIWRSSSGTAVITITIIHDDLLLGQLWSSSLSYRTIFWDSCNNYHYYTWRSSSGTAVINFTIIHDDLLLGQLWSQWFWTLQLFFFTRYMKRVFPPAATDILPASNPANRLASTLFLYTIFCRYLFRYKYSSLRVFHELLMNDESYYRTFFITFNLILPFYNRGGGGVPPDPRLFRY